MGTSDILSVVFLFAFFHQTSEALKIISTIEKSCIVDTDLGRLDLSHLARSDEPRFSFSSTTSGYTYFWNPCKDIKPEGCSDVGQIFIDGYESCIVGPGRDEAYFDVSQGSLVLAYLSGFKTNITMKCTDEADKFTIPEEMQPTLMASFAGKSACFAKASPTAAPHSNSHHIGTILIIIVLVLAVCYVFFGVLLCKLVVKAEGAQVFPNFNFWKDLPFLIKDGFLFTVKGCKTTEGAQYDKL